MARRSIVSRALITLGASVAMLALGPAAAGATNRPVHPTTQPVLSDASAERFFLETLEEKLRGDWGRAWQSLYPLHRRIATRGTFVRCETQTPFPAPLQSLRVVDVRDATVRVPGVRQPVPGVAVEVVVELEWYGPRDPIVFRHMFHLVPVHGHWTWLLSPSRYRLYERHACLTENERVEAREAVAQGSRIVTATSSVSSALPL
jgi:hypothetical protein